VSELTDQMTRELLALTADDPRVRQLLAEAWHIGYVAGQEGSRVNPFATDIP
jgi:hypothetical protein